MEKNNILKNDEYLNVLQYAITDKNLKCNHLKVLIYIVFNVDFVYIEDMKETLNIKTSNTISNCINVLIKNQYITRSKNKQLIKKGVPFFSYSINTNKPLLPNNNNSNIINNDDYFNNIDEIFNFFFENIQSKNNKKISVVTQKKAIELIIFKDDIEIKKIKEIIKFLTKSNKYNIYLPTQLRKEIKNILNDDDFIKSIS
jgi:hypothetical protein